MLNAVRLSLRRLCTSGESMLSFLERRAVSRRLQQPCHVLSTGDSIPNAQHIQQDAGLSLIELIITVAILGILASAAIPLAMFQVKREKEIILRHDLWEMRAAIDAYKDAADSGAFQTKVGSYGYPPSLQVLVNGVDVHGTKVRFLPRIPVDPMTGTTDWGLRSMQDGPNSTSWGGQNVFDVYTKSTGTALDGTKYSTW